MIIIIFFLLFYVILYIINDNYEHFEQEPLLNETEKLNLLKALLTIHNLFEKNDIWYVIAFGTLLGAVRHHGLIPWDDDADLLVKVSDLEKIRKLKPEFEKMGYKYEESWKLIRIYSDDKHFIDLFIIDIQDDKVIRCQNDKTCKYPDKTNDWWWKWFGFSEDLIKERVKYHFDGVSLYGSKKAYELLEFWYNRNFLTECKTNYLVNHGESTTTPKKLSCGKLPKPQIY